MKRCQLKRYNFKIKDKMNKENKTCYCGNYSDRFISTSGSCTICGKKEKKLDIMK